MYISGTFDPRWNNDVLNPAFRALSASDFEVVQLGWRGTTGPPHRRAPFRRRQPISGSSVTGYGVSLGWTPPGRCNRLARARRRLGAGAHQHRAPCRSRRRRPVSRQRPRPGVTGTRPRAGVACGVGAASNEVVLSPRPVGVRHADSARARSSSRASRARCRSPWGPASSATTYAVEAGYAPRGGKAKINNVGASRFGWRPGAARHLLRAGVRGRKGWG